MTCITKLILLTAPYETIIIRLRRICWYSPPRKKSGISVGYSRRRSRQINRHAEYAVRP